MDTNIINHYLNRIFPRLFKDNILQRNGKGDFGRLTAGKSLQVKTPIFGFYAPDVHNIRAGFGNNPDLRFIKTPASQ